MSNTQSTVPQSTAAKIQTVPWHRRASVWLGLGINPASISLGGGLAQRLSLFDLCWIIPLSAALLSLICTAEGLIGRRRRQQLAQIAADTFGRGSGSSALNLMLVIGMIGWGGFQGGVSGASLAQLLNWPDWAGAILMVMGLLVLSELGINRWAALVWVTTLSALALAIFALVTIDLTPVRATLTASSTPTTWLWAVGTTISYAMLFSLRNADFSHDMRRDSDVVKANLCLFFPIVFAMFAGAMLFGATGDWNIADVLTTAQSAALGHIFLIMAVISPLLSGYYSGSLALSNASKFTARQSIYIIAILGAVLAATRFDQLLIPFLGVLGASLGPALAVILFSQLLPSKASKIATNGAWIIGALAAITLQLQGRSIHVFGGAIAAIGALLMLYPITSLNRSVSSKR